MIMRPPIKHGLGLGINRVGPTDKKEAKLSYSAPWRDAKPWCSVIVIE
jgi:hypothetical protein